MRKSQGPPAPSTKVLNDFEMEQEKFLLERPSLSNSPLLSRTNSPVLEEENLPSPMLEEKNPPSGQAPTLVKRKQREEPQSENLPALSPPSTQIYKKAREEDPPRLTTERVVWAALHKNMHSHRTIVSSATHLI